MLTPLKVRLQIRSFQILAWSFAVSAVLKADVSALSSIDVTYQSTRSLGMAGTGTAISDNESAFFLNPAGVARQIEYRRVAAQNHFIDKMTHWNLGLSVMDGITEAPIAWGFNFDTVHTPLLRREDYLVPVAINILDQFHLGLQSSFKYWHGTRATPSQFIYSMDAGALVFLGDYISVGAAGENLYRTKQIARLAPIKLRGGIAFNFFEIRLAGDVERNISQKITSLKGGVEYQVQEGAIVRSGFFYSPKPEEYGYSLGGSLVFFQNFSTDIGFLDQLKSSFWDMAFGFSYRF